MAGAVTIKTLEEDIRWQADQERAVLRHTPEKLRRAINQSIKSYREMVSDEGWPYFLVQHTGTMPVGQKISEEDPSVRMAWGELSIEELSPAVARIYGFDLHYQGIQEELSSVSYSDRNIYSRSTGINHIPQKYFIYNETKIGLIPPADAAYNFTLHYLPVIPDLSADDDEFNPGVLGGEQWVIWDVMLKIAARDNLSELGTPAMNERQRQEGLIMHKIGKLLRDFPKKRRDTRGRDHTRLRRIYWASDAGNR